ncbi:MULTISPECIES: hypothetical protein [unclassified Empedobacter]|uniref:hypothetical protein n=1 Tax=unclassified Empedobacter TaxID=2643773 RepID=UPI0025C28782|nr:MULTISPECIES: hypothetical protein [unclassified Empedobacter]
MNLIKKTAIALSLFALTGSSVAFAQKKTPTKATKIETVKTTTKASADKKGTHAKKDVKVTTIKKTEVTPKGKTDKKVVSEIKVEKTTTPKNETKTNVAKTTTAGN